MSVPFGISDKTVGNVLKRHGIAPAPQRKHTTRWRDFIRAHMGKGNKLLFPAPRGPLQRCRRGTCAM